MIVVEIAFVVGKYVCKLDTRSCISFLLDIGIAFGTCKMRFLGNDIQVLNSGAPGNSESASERIQLAICFFSVTYN